MAEKICSNNTFLSYASTLFVCQKMLGSLFIYLEYKFLGMEFIMLFFLGVLSSSFQVSKYGWSGSLIVHFNTISSIFLFVFLKFCWGATWHTYYI